MGERMVLIIFHPELMAGVFSICLGNLPLQLYLRHNLYPWEDHQGIQTLEEQAELSLL